MRRTLSALLLAGPLLLAQGLPAHAADVETFKGYREFLYQYPGYTSGYKLTVGAWINMDYTNQQTRGYARSDAPNFGGFVSSAQARNRRDGGSFPTTALGPQVFNYTQGYAESSSPLLGCFGGATFSADNIWTSTDNNDITHKGVWQSHTSQSTCTR